MYVAISAVFNESKHNAPIYIYIHSCCRNYPIFGVLLYLQAYWDARSVSELRFDKVRSFFVSVLLLQLSLRTCIYCSVKHQTLKNLYRQFENKKEAHHVTVSNIVKGVWPSYRIMRKQHEGRSKASAVLVTD